MSKVILVLLSFVLALPLVAQQAPDEVAPAPGAGPMPSQQMHARMQAMQEQMARIHATQDPTERQRLMQEHMRSMQANMAMMGRMGQGHGGMRSQCGQGDMACRMEEMQGEQSRMQERMGMMQQMMEQMMQHMHEAEPPAAEQSD